ncbi:MAG: MCE family protein [Bacteroidetes bacterium HGW-Bacteroidetes-15]|nr:MAG: MCE family protein [Bacteroidetes bacterium HGW-Bacteroidetes-15]
MNTHSTKFKVRLGLFVAAGFVLFGIAIFLIGRQKNMFNPVFSLSTTFYNVSGLQVGNNIRFSGINVGTVDNIKIINDSTVLVNMVVQKDVQRFIKTDGMVLIGSEGIIGDRVLVITQGSSETKSVKSGQFLSSVEPVETDAIMASLDITAQNAEIISGQLIEILYDINQGKGTLGMLIQDSTMAESLNKTMGNLQKSSKGLKENMEAAKSNFLLRGYFRKKEKAAEKAKQEAIDSKKE